MIHVAAMALLALSLNQVPNTGRAKAKFPPRTEKPRPPPPQQPTPDTPAPSQPHDDAPPPQLPSQPPPFQEEPYLAVIRSHSPQIESCYARARAWSPAVQGEVIVEWDISPGGNVFGATVTSNTTGNSELASCVLQEVKSWIFRASDSSYPTHVRHPFRFQSS
ncbi:AgmX/PglI C-terminal domain-containing protein [Hyalangium minutum]|uniref:FHA domain containing protein n=1 Tax=Hyalangium minutum TaxID=394096 RepID=A0A085WMM2_9BACT|nr:AgmX/PglI C-terminal domain-containing protein [Hyalangium minutum]KFE68935.1 FHA domain containing protein [Hyalangium minutum]